MRLGAGAFVCGEETALIASIEGLRGTPRPRPPYPAVKGLWQQPSCVNNVETLANVPRILLNGAEWFASMGTEKSKGTKVFALTGKIKNNGLVEVPMGITLRQIVEVIGGGTGTERKIKAIQTGGPSGGMIPDHQFDTPVSYEHLKDLGSIMGSGGLIVIDDHDSVVELAQFYLDFCVDESCGKCAPCRIGGTQMLRLLDRIVGGKGTEEDIRTIRKVAKAMQTASLCALVKPLPIRCSRPCVTSSMNSPACCSLPSPNNPDHYGWKRSPYERYNSRYDQRIACGSRRRRHHFGGLATGARAHSHAV